MTITEANKKESVDFINALNNILEIVDNLSQTIGDNNYLEISNNLKILYENRGKEELIRYIEVARERVVNNPIVSSHTARIKMKVKSKTEMLTDAQKLKKGWKVCPKCDRLIRNMSEHNFTDVCKRTNESKKITLKCNSVITDNYMNSIHRLRGIFINYNGFKRNMIVIKNGIEN